MPEQSGRYRLDDLIGRGGMGEVWAAYDSETDRQVALKLLIPELATPDFIARFERESQMAAKLTNPHIVPIHGYGNFQGRLYIDMPLIRGRNLREILNAENRLPVDRAVHLVRQVARALDAAHEAGLVHRDVKPSNILVVGDPGEEHAYLIDFGISRPVRRQRRQRTITGDGELIGTLHYMAPERFEGSPGDSRSDVYALACVLFEAVTGQKAFDGPDLRRAHRDHRPRRASMVVEEIPSDLSDVIVQGMAKKSHHRFDHASEFADAALRAIGGQVTSSHRTPPRRTTSSSEPPVRTRVGPPLRTGSRRRRNVIAAIAATAAALAGIGTWIFWPADQTPDLSIPVGDAPVAAAFSTDGSKAYVADSGAGTVSVVDLSSRSVEATIPVGADPRAIVVSRSSPVAYVANRGANTVSVLNLSSKTVTATIPVGKSPTSIAITRDAARVYVANGDSADVSMIETASNTVSRTISVSVWPWDTVQGIAVTSDGSRVVVAKSAFIGQDTVAILDPTRGRSIAEIGLGDGPDGLTVSEDGHYAYVAEDAASVAVVDLSSGGVTTRIPLEVRPAGVVLGPGGVKAYVINKDEGRLTVINTATNLTETTPSKVGHGPFALSPDGQNALLLDTASDSVESVPLD